MMKRSKTKMKLFAVLTVLCLSLSAFTSVLAADTPVLLESPAKDAAVVERMEGFKVSPHEGKLGTNNSTEGLVIRKSYIKDGKIYIPPSGLYYTARFGNYLTNPLADNAISLLGKKYNWVDFRFVQDVLTDAKFEKVGDKVPFGDGTKALELTGLSLTSPGFISPVATFSILKPSGNYYGNTFSVNTELTQATEIVNGTGKKTGTYGLAGEDGSWIQNAYYYSNVACVGATYLVAESVAKDEVIIKEFGTGALEYFMVTETDPQKFVLAVDEEVEIGDWKLSVTNIGENTAAVKLSNAATGATLEKEFGPLTTESISRMPADQIQRNQFVLRDDANEIQVQLDIYDNPFSEENKVKLTAFTDIVVFKNPEVWPTDERFIMRPDTCASCNLPIEVMLENIETIVLDSTDNVYVGPDGYFKLVIEEFDGETIGSWYIEDAEGNKTENLAKRAGGKHVDLLLGDNVRTVSHFIGRIQNDLNNELKARMAELEEMLKDHKPDAQEEAPALEVEIPAEEDCDC